MNLSLCYSSILYSDLREVKHEMGKPSHRAVFLVLLKTTDNSQTSAKYYHIFP